MNKTIVMTAANGKVARVSPTGQVRVWNDKKSKWALIIRNAAGITQDEQCARLRKVNFNL